MSIKANISMKKAICFSLTFLILGTAFLHGASGIKVNVAFINTHQQLKNDSEVQAAIKFLRSDKIFNVNIISFDKLKKNPSVLKDIDVLWFHRPDSSAYSVSESDKNVATAIDEFVKKGGGLFLSLDAFKYINVMGLEIEIPEIRYIEAKDEGYGRKLGLHALRSHPIFTGLNGGSYIWDAYKNNVARQVGFFGSSVPKNGKVAAVNWAYITLKDDEKLAVEYKLGKGKVLAVGAYTYFAPKNFERLNLEKFTDNCLLYLSGKLKSNEKPRYWSYAPLKVEQFSETSPSIKLPAAKVWNEETNGMTLTSQFGSSNTWDLGQQRILLMGKEKGGIDEVWIHPFMALRDYEVGIQFSYKDTIYWFDDQRPEIEVRPGSFTRTYRFARAFVKEIISGSVDKPAAVIHYEYRGLYPAKLVIKFKSNLRFMWPYNSDALGSILYSWDGGLNAFRVKNQTDEFNVLIGSNRKPVEKIIGQFDGITKIDSAFKGVPTDKFQAAGLAEFNLAMNDNLDVIIAGTDEGKDVAVKDYEEVMENPEKIFEETANYYKNFLNSKLMVTTPEKDFNTGYRWALVGTDKFFVNTPGIGNSLVAGYSTTARGWDGAQKVSGRPGYAWYFGRDGEWSGMALSDYGDFYKVKAELETYQKYQALSGKIYHELTTSGVVHYDAADATPLYIVLAGYYLKWSGDINFIKQSWTHIKKAIDYCFSTDFNHDHLIENINVGHGWVEGGALYGGRTTLYLAGCWAEALREAAYMAGNLNLQKEEKNYSKEFETVKKIINKDFWNSKENFFYDSQMPDGSYSKEKTIQISVPIYFGVINKKKTYPVLDAYSGNNFSSDWGTRIIGENNPAFSPNGYHLGSVWPLFTGWTALAEYNNNQYVQGYSHIMNNLLNYKNWARGYVEEVLNGKVYQPSGVCDHQCWSETMVLQPALEGMLGLNADAFNNELTISPRLPFNWNFINVERIKVGDQSLNFKMKRDAEKTVYNFRQEREKKLAVNFIPTFPLGTTISKILVNGKETKFNLEDDSQSESIKLHFNIEDKTEIEIFHSGGISVLPVVAHPIPNDSSEGFRILSSRLNGNEYSVKVQGKPKHDEILKIYSPSDQIKSIEGGEKIDYKNQVYSIKVIFPDGKEKYVNKIVGTFLKQQHADDTD
ncbi:MAG: GH116 family glycosyl hydrolase [Bacteroidetes bacterium]|nr:GH116 family glycosyl hydrolase [Bacteroidota bacterium]